jgi:hypothetical protein
MNTTVGASLHCAPTGHCHDTVRYCTYRHTNKDRLYCTTVHRVWVWKSEGDRSIGRPRLRWEDNNKMVLQEVGCGNVDWIQLAQDRDRWLALVYAVMNLRVP